MITAKELSSAYDQMIKCGMSEKAANQEIGFAVLQVNGHKDLSKADKIEIIKAVAMVAYTCLSLNPHKQEAALSSYNEKGQKGVFFLPMYRGLLKVAILEGSILAANSQVINEGDDYQINAGQFRNPVKHIVKAFQKERKPVVTYTVLALPNGLETVTLFYEDEYQTLQAKAKNKREDSPHKMWSDEMRKKSSLKRALKNTPSGSSDSKLDYLIDLDNQQYYLNGIPKEAREQPTNTLPELTSKHEKWESVISGLKQGTLTLDIVRKHLFVSAENESKLLKLSKTKANAEAV